MHLTTVQFIFYTFRTLLAIVYDAAWPVAGNTIPGLVSFPPSL
jgi:hypothetical protein